MASFSMKFGSNSDDDDDDADAEEEEEEETISLFDTISSFTGCFLGNMINT